MPPATEPPRGWPRAERALPTLPSARLHEAAGEAAPPLLPPRSRALGRQGWRQGALRPPRSQLPAWGLLGLTVTGNCLSEVLSDSLTEQWMTLSETIWISQEIRPIFTWYSLLSRPRLSGSFW